MAIAMAWVVCGATGVCCRADVPDPGTVFPQPAFTAEQFVEFIGLNAAPFDIYIDKGKYKASGTKYAPQVFFDLGVRHYRMVLKNARTPADAAQRVRAAYEQYGARPAMLIDPGKDGPPEQVVALLKEYGGSEVIGALEGPNEVNNKFPPQELNLKYGKKRDEAAGALYMQDYYKVVKADPATRDIPVINFTAIFTDYRLARPCDAFDYNNMHSYQGYRVPSSSLLKNFIRCNNILPVGSVIKPFMPTECGYNIEEDKTNQIKGNGSPQAQATNMPMLLGEYFRHGFVKRVYLFALHNADGYGLLESDQETKRPAYYALQSLIAALKDATWNTQTKAWEGGQFTPRALLFTVEGAPPTFKSITLQKRSGEYSLLMWNELPNWDSTARRDITNAPVTVTLSFSTPIGTKAQVLRQDDSGAFKVAQDLALENDSLRIAVPSALIIVRLAPNVTDPASPIAAPPKIEAQATENSVHLTWQAPAKATDVAGYFVYRNGWCVASLPAGQPSFDDLSPWIRPGLGYTYEVQAYDRKGNMSDRAATVAQTAAKFPDLVIADFGLEKDVQPGDTVRFRAKVRNVGNGATPVDVPISGSFRIAGQMLAWFTVEGVLKPGEEREYVTNGGPKGTALWTAEAGTHTLVSVMDDINRIPGEKNKNNNFSDRTLVIGAAPAGQLLGRSAAAPWRIDLSAEGSEDWVHWGLEDAASVTRKAGAGQIGALEMIGKGHLGSTKGTGIRCIWSNGEPVASMEATNSALWLNGVGNGYAITAPADTIERVLKVYASGIGGATCSLSATLSDGSAPPYVSKTWSGNSGHGSSAPVPGDFAAVYTIRYRATSDAQTLRVEFKLDADASRFQGQARLSAATLSRAPAK
ncbi:MAG: CARDB domain-containing protein [Phycisphaeraceae bacterium]